MLKTTEDAMRAMLRADPSITTSERARIRAALRAQETPLLSDDVDTLILAGGGKAGA